MENASKALIIAVGVFIAILLIALLVSMEGNVSSIVKKQVTAEEMQQIVEFNRQYTKYINQYVYGTEVRTLINKYENDGMVKVLPDSLKEMAPKGVGQDTQYYKCTNIGYDNLGRVNSITFEEITISQ